MQCCLSYHPSILLDSCIMVQWCLACQRLVIKIRKASKKANAVVVIARRYSSEFVMWAIEVKNVDVESIPKWEEKELLK